jgi:ATP-dependent Zn protease
MKPAVTPEDARQSEYYTAVHESGHAVANIVLGIGLKPKGMTIVPQKLRDGGVALGMTHSRVSGRNSKHWIRKRIMYTLAGCTAEERVNENGWQDGRDEDVDQVHTLLWEISGSPEEFSALNDELLAETAELVSKHWDSILRLADRLVQSKTLSGQEVEAIVNLRTP